MTLMNKFLPGDLICCMSSDRLMTPAPGPLNDTNRQCGSLLAGEITVVIAVSPSSSRRFWEELFVMTKTMHTGWIDASSYIDLVQRTEGT